MPVIFSYTAYSSEVQHFSQLTHDMTCCIKSKFSIILLPHALTWRHSWVTWYIDKARYVITGLVIKIFLITSQIRYQGIFNVTNILFCSPMHYYDSLYWIHCSFIIRFRSLILLHDWIDNQNPLHIYPDSSNAYRLYLMPHVCIACNE